jgi:2-methylisocitrate lyase-like PEP mutase family enzyme
VNRADRHAAFAALHVPGRPVVLVNAWDAGSAAALAKAGAPAIATASWAVAAAHGFRDGEQLPRDLAMANLARIVAAVGELPVSADLEAGYGAGPDGVGETVALAVAAGAVGCNLEDADPATGAVRPLDEAAARIAAARAAAGADFFINARTDLFLTSAADAHAGHMDAAIARAHAFAAAGASGLFAPGLAEPGLIARLAEASPLPLNLMAVPGLPPTPELARLGVARISHGPGAWRAAMAALRDYAAAAYAPAGTGDAR